MVFGEISRPQSTDCSSDLFRTHAHETWHAVTLYYIHVLLISNNYVNVSRGGGGVNTFFVGRRLAGGRAGGHPRGTALLTCRFGIKWTCNTPCSNRFHIVSSSTSSEPPPWVALSHLNRHNTATTYTHITRRHIRYTYTLSCTI